MSELKTTATHWNANEYSKNSQLQYDAAMSMLAQYHFKGNEHVLDVGCGDGKITYQIALKVPRGNVIGVDSSESMIQFAKKNYLSQKNLFFELKGAQNLNFKNQFDLVTSMFCLQWVPDKLAAFKEIQKSLKPQGKVILIMPFRNQQTAKLRETMVKESHWKKYFINYFDQSAYGENNQYEKYAKEAGLTVNSYTTEPVTTFFQDKSTFVKFLRNITPHVNQLPDENKKIEFMKELVERYVELIPPSNSQYQITYTYAKMFASKPND